MSHWKKILNFFDKLEDKVRGKLSKYPILYGFIAGIGLVLFWRGVWHIADEVNIGSFISIALGAAILLVTGIFVSEFLGKQLIITGLEGEQELEKKEEKEIKTEETQIKKLENTLERLEEKIDRIEGEIEPK